MKQLDIIKEKIKREDFKKASYGLEDFTVKELRHLMNADDTTFEKKVIYYAEILKRKAVEEQDIVYLKEEEKHSLNTEDDIFKFFVDNNKQKKNEIVLNIFNTFYFSDKLKEDYNKVIDMNFSCNENVNELIKLKLIRNKQIKIINQSLPIGNFLYNFIQLKVVFKTVNEAMHIKNELDIV